MLKITLREATIKAVAMKNGRLRFAIDAPGGDSDIDIGELSQALADTSFSATVTISGKVQQALLSDVKKRGGRDDDEGAHGRG